ncbi:MAG: ferritin-like domain-containing protein [Verrucomicrobiota bacterium]
MNSRDWLEYYRQNRRDRLPIAWDQPIRGAAVVQAGVARSLARFQLGESSEGTRLRQAAHRLARRTGDSAYAEAIELFISEEQEHARLLGVALNRFAVPRLRHHWSDWLFRRCRHGLGFYEEIMVLLMAEIVALKYYSVVRDGTADSALQRVCDQILHDEKFHVRFHCEYLHRWLAVRPPVVQRLAGWGLAVLFAGASTVVAWDHRAAFAALGSSAEEFLDDSWENFAAVRQAILTGEAFVWSRKLRRVESPAPVRPRQSEVQLVWTLGVRSWRWLWLLSYRRPQLAWPGRR